MMLSSYQLLERPYLRVFPTVYFNLIGLAPQMKTTILRHRREFVELHISGRFYE